MTMEHDVKSFVVVKGGPQHPCGKGCPRRCVGCAVHCPEWAAYVKEREAWRAERYFEICGTPKRKYPKYKPNSR